MSSPLESHLSTALAIRIKLQVSLSSLPVVEEWMDIHLTRWLESIPLPPEMPLGHSAHFGVAVATDRSRLRWSAYGNPDGFIPKMARYFQACKIPKRDAQLLDEMGNRLEPELVGSWISVIAGTITSGWHFCDEHPFEVIQSLFGDHEAKRRLVSWLESAGIANFRRFSQSIGDDAVSQIEFSVPGVSVDDQLRRAGQAFEALADMPLPEHVLADMSSAVSPGISVAVSIHQGMISNLEILSPNLGNDVIVQLCRNAEVEYHADTPKFMGTLGADGADRVAYACDPGSAAPGRQVDIHVIPTDAEYAPPGEVN